MIQLHNTLTKSKQTIDIPLTRAVTLYSCGQTVYDYTHIGNLRAHTTTDTLRRMLECSGYPVHHVRNYTDVGHLTADDIGQGDEGEDKMLKAARKEGKSVWDIAKFYTEYFDRVTNDINLLPATDSPKATDYIPQMIALIEQLIAGGHAYTVNGNVFFRVTSFPSYGELSGNTLEKLKVGARLEEHPDKENPWDFALWLRAPENHIMKWKSPWGIGYPGWHIECSAMSSSLLGSGTIDFHTGGEDNIFPHHEAEIAQSECTTHQGHPFVTTWIHTRHLLVDGVKMSKSKGNFYKLEDILERGYTPMDLRILYLMSHYRTQMNFTWDSMDQARELRYSLERLHRRALKISDTAATASTIERDLLDCLQDDLNTPLALTYVQEFITHTNKHLDAGGTADVHGFYTCLERLLGLAIAGDAAPIPVEVTTKANARQTAKESKDYALADELRAQIVNLGYQVKDTKDGYELERIS
jgi:cysteinyl-tRNA synthetase